MAVTPQLFHPMSGTARVSAVHQQLAEQDVFLQEIRGRLEQSQQYYKSFNDKKHYIEDMYPESSKEPDTTICFRIIKGKTDMGNELTY
jgi:hypothetical protein